MKRNLLLISVIASLQTFAQAPLARLWDYRYGGDKHDYLSSFIKTSDGGFMLGGSSLSDSSGDKTQSNWDTTLYSTDYWVVKLDASGIKEWEKSFGGTNNDRLTSLQQTSDGGYILGGYSYSDSSGDKTQPLIGLIDYWIVKLDSTGTKQWDKDFGGTLADLLYSIQQTNDGGYIFGGHSRSGINGDKTQANWDTTLSTPDYWIIKTDSLGIKLWDKVFGGTGSDALFSIEQTNDNGYILGGWTYSDSSGDMSQHSNGVIDYWIVKTDSLGIKQWDKTYGGSSVDYMYFIRQTFDHGYILGGTSGSPISGDKTEAAWGGLDIWIVKVDSLGNIQHDKDFGGTAHEDEFGNILEVDSGYLISVTSYSDSSGNKSQDNLGLEQAWIIKTDSLLNMQWDKTIFTLGHDETAIAIHDNDGCFAFATYDDKGIGGYKTQPNWDPADSTYDYWIVKFCDTTTTDVQEITNTNSIEIFPNPANSILNLFVSIKENIIITNLLGEIVLQKTAEGKIELDVSSLSAGIYFIKAGSVVKKFVKE